MDETISKLKDEEKSNNDYFTKSCDDHNDNLLWGIILIGIGASLLLNQLDVSWHLNWWAFFFLFPAYGNFKEAWQAYQANGRFNNAVRSPLTWGIAISFFASLFLFDWDWAIFLPAMLILFGVSSVVGSRLED